MKKSLTLLLGLAIFGTTIQAQIAGSIFLGWNETRVSETSLDPTNVFHVYPNDPDGSNNRLNEDFTVTFANGVSATFSTVNSALDPDVRQYGDGIQIQDDDTAFLDGELLTITLTSLTGGTLGINHLAAKGDKNDPSGWATLPDGTIKDASVADQWETDFTPVDWAEGESLLIRSLTDTGDNDILFAGFQVVAVAESASISPYLGWDITDSRVEALPNAQQIFTGLSENTTVPDANAGFSLDFGGGMVATFSVTDGDGNIRVYRNSTGTGSDGQALMFTLDSLTGAASLELSYISLTSVEPDDALVTLSGTDWSAEAGGPIEPAVPWLPGETLAANNLYVDAGTYNVVGFTVAPVAEQAMAWAGYPMDEAGNVDTGDWLGWIDVSGGDYVWSYTLNQWLYLPETIVGENGSWMYIFR